MLLLFVHMTFFFRLHGSYEALRESSLSDILVDTTAGVSQVIDLKGEEYMSNEDKRWELFETLISENNDHSIICFTIAVIIKQVFNHLCQKIYHGFGFSYFSKTKRYKSELAH